MSLLLLRTVLRFCVIVDTVQSNKCLDIYILFQSKMNRTIAVYQYTYSPQTHTNVFTKVRHKLIFRPTDDLSQCHVDFLSRHFRLYLN